MEISVVIPTIGDRDILPTIVSLNNSTVIPTEIIIVSLKENSYEYISKKYKNVVFTKAEKKGQVNQRIQGFKIAKSKFVMQLDDDIILHKSCLEFLTKNLSLNKNCSVSPNLFENLSNRSIYDYKIDLKKICFNIISGFSAFCTEGKIGFSGFELYPLVSEISPELVKSEWLVGGCIMHHKKNLIKEYFFDFEGKAYCEDLFHSIELRKKKIELYINKSAIAYLELNEKPKKIKDFIGENSRDLKIRKNFVIINDLSIFRMYTVYVLKFFNYFFSKKSF